MEQKNNHREGFGYSIKPHHKIRAGEIPHPTRNGVPSELTENDYKEFALKHRKDIFKISEEEPELDDDGNVVKKHVGLKM